MILLPDIIQFKMRRTADKGCRRELTVQQLSTYIHMHWLLPPRFSPLLKLSALLAIVSFQIMVIYYGGSIIILVA